MGFTMPWVSCAGSVSTGIDVANRNEFVWFFPVAAIAALVLLFTKPTSVAQMKKMYLYVTGCGLASTAIVVLFFLKVLWILAQMDEESREFVGFHLGIDFSILGSSALLISGIKAYRSVSVSPPQEDSILQTNSPAPLLPK
jgi:hypothetical protein